MKRGVIAAIAVSLAVPAAAQDKQPPYWASIASGQAMTRAGPGKNYPGVWLYQRRDLPIRAASASRRRFRKSPTAAMSNRI